jgi:anti-sigma-K factor RskA
VTKSRSGSIHALSGAYVVDALDDAERAAFEEHLPGCHDCEAEVASLREATAVLADDAALTPPASLRANVLAGIRTVRPLPPEVEGAAEPGDQSEGAVAKVVPLRRHRFRMANLAVAAAVVAILGFAAVAQPWQNNNSGQHQVGLADRVMAAVDAKQVKVSFADGATATVVRSEKLGKAVLVTEKMPAAPDGKVYELWLRNSAGRMVPAGLMKGSGDQKQVLQGNAAVANAAAISVEPSGGSTEPTSDPIALFDFQQAGT